MSTSGDQEPLGQVEGTETPGMEVPPENVALHPGRLDVSVIYVMEAFVGVWLFLSPWILGDYNHRGALVNGMLLGGVVIVGSIASAAAVSATTEVIVDQHHWWGRATIAIGVWLVVCSPLVDLDALHTTVVNNILVGIALITLGYLANHAAVTQISESATTDAVI